VQRKPLEKPDVQSTSPVLLELGDGNLSRLLAGLAREIDQHLELLNIHVLYHELDYVLHITYNVLLGGVRLEDIELRRQNEVFLNALIHQHINYKT
jgi:hypothetical protein